MTSDTSLRTVSQGYAGLLLSVALILLGACGQSGPLYEPLTLPPAPPVQAEPSDADATHQDNPPKAKPNTH